MIVTVVEIGFNQRMTGFELWTKSHYLCSYHINIYEIVYIHQYQFINFKKIDNEFKYYKNLIDTIEVTSSDHGDKSPYWKHPPYILHIDH